MFCSRSLWFSVLLIPAFVFANECELVFSDSLEISGCSADDPLLCLCDDFETDSLSDWQLLNPGDADLFVDTGQLRLTAQANTLWFRQNSAFFMWKSISGNFKLTAHVTARGVSDPLSPPMTSFRLGGIAARNPDTSGNCMPGPACENYVFIVVGADGNDVSVEYKSTRESISMFNGPARSDSDRELRICRIDDSFFLYDRAPGSFDWGVPLVEYVREDLPESLQLGALTYANASPPDLTVDFQFIDFQSVLSEADCTL